MAILRSKTGEIKMVKQFMTDVDSGLSADNKYLSSKYFYDKIGDALFVDIMNLPEYYLTRAEFEIFSAKTNELIELLGVEKDKHFELLELGAGDGTKTIELLRVLLQEGYDFAYDPVDISSNALRGLKTRLESELPGLTVNPQQGDYFEVLSSFKNSGHKKIVLFLGSNIGNLTDDLAAKFMYELGANLQKSDKLLLGVDLIKSKEIVLPAYDDLSGITKEFNLNLLARINRDLGANFIIEQFDHAPQYEESEGIVKSFLRSKIDQQVEIAALNKSFHFRKGELIHTEISRKYNERIMSKILHDTDFSIVGKLTDSRGYFADYVLQRA